MYFLEMNIKVIRDIISSNKWSLCILTQQLVTKLITLTTIITISSVKLIHENITIYYHIQAILMTPIFVEFFHRNFSQFFFGHKISLVFCEN